MVLSMIVFVFGFMAVLYYFSKTVVQQLEHQADEDVLRAKESYENIIHQKERAEIERLRLEDEANKIFTMFEITRELAKTYNELDAFETFKRKLHDNIRFEDIKILDVDADMVREFRRNKEYQILTLRGKRRLGYLAYKGVKEFDKDTFMILVNQFALVWRRIKLYKELELMATTDGLTGVNTRRHFLEQLEGEIERSKAQKISLAFLMLDVDHFKRINDTYGHLTGDHVLREVARIIKENIREIDIAGRYGGEEFCVVLPDTDRKGALMVAERIRKSVEETLIKAYDAELNLTLSIGLSTFPEDAQVLPEVIDKADWALYRAKKIGRNRVVVFDLHDDK